jgi:hypothetical protein
MAGGEYGWEITNGTKRIDEGKTDGNGEAGEDAVEDGGAGIESELPQWKRIYAVCQRRGEEALIYDNAWKAANRKTKENVRADALAAYRERYSDFGPTFAAEKLEEREGIRVGISALRRRLIVSKKHIFIIRATTILCICDIFEKRIPFLTNRALQVPSDRCFLIYLLPVLLRNYQHLRCKSLIICVVAIGIDLPQIKRFK